MGVARYGGVESQGGGGNLEFFKWSPSTALQTKE